MGTSQTRKHPLSFVLALIDLLLLVFFLSFTDLHHVSLNKGRWRCTWICKDEVLELDSGTLLEKKKLGFSQDCKYFIILIKSIDILLLFQRHQVSLGKEASAFIDLLLKVALC